jgi:exosortase D (VPLPA-CTERM-specific)
MTTLHSLPAGEDLHPGQRGTALSRAGVLTTLLAILCIALVCVNTRDGLANLYDRWRYEEEYGYGFLIVALVPLLLWRRWHAIAPGRPGSGWPGLAIVLIAQLSAAIAVFGQSYFIEQISLVVSILGVGLAAFGRSALRAFIPITLLLLLTVPLPYTLQAMLTIKLELISTNIGVAIIQFFGIPVYSDGNIIDLGLFKLQVAEACSGLRYLLPLTCLSFLIAYLYKAPLWKKVVVVVLATPLTILLNSLRIAATALLVNYFGSRMAEGFLHEFEGFAVFIAGVPFVLLEIWALEAFRWSKVTIEPVLERVPTVVRPRTSPTSLPLIACLIVCSGALSLTNSIVSADASITPPDRESFAEFPRHIDRWTGQPIPLDSATLEILKDTDTYNGDFVEGPGLPQANLFIAYYDSLAKGAAIHSPQVCLPASGWEFSSFKEKSFSDLEPGVSGTYNDVVIQKGEQKMIVYYWYQQRERRTANEFMMKYYLLLDSFSKRRYDGAMIRLLTTVDPAAGNRGVAQAEERLHLFAQAVFSRLPSYLPH